MQTIRQRAILSAVSTPVLRRHARLQYDSVRQAWAVLSPERVFWPNDVSLDILRLCDGNHAAEEIIEILSAQYETPAEHIRPDVELFLQEWSDRFLVEL